jgi:transposase
MDNASHHKSKPVMEFLEKTTEITPFFLPRYAPELNEVENINRRLKADINTNYSYKNLKELRKTTINYLYVLNNFET